jgi:alpha-1,2-mannosyltransferase
MLAQVRERTASFNNASVISQSPMRTAAKLAYYRLFAWLYGMVGAWASVVVVNSTWTGGHIRALWGGHPHVVFPPCDTAALASLPIRSAARRPWIVSVAQFRYAGAVRPSAADLAAGLTNGGRASPEKNHRLQLEALARLFALAPARRAEVRLVLVGSSRNTADEARIAALRRAAHELGVQDQVDVCVNVPFAELRRHLATATIGLHTMRDEHFGIGIVEYMVRAGTPPHALCV